MDYPPCLQIIRHLEQSGPAAFVIPVYSTVSATLHPQLRLVSVDPHFICSIGMDLAEFKKMWIDETDSS